jgi:hypothetical protein
MCLGENKNYDLLYTINMSLFSKPRYEGVIKLRVFIPHKPTGFTTDLPASLPSDRNMLGA